MCSLHVKASNGFGLLDLVLVRVHGAYLHLPHKVVPIDVHLVDGCYHCLLLGYLVMGMWWFFWVLYYVLLVLVVCFLLWWRRTKTVIYNVDPEVFSHLLHDSLDSLGLVGTRANNRVIIISKGMATGGGGG